MDFGTLKCPQEHEPFRLRVLRRDFERHRLPGKRDHSP